MEANRASNERARRVRETLSGERVRLERVSYVFGIQEQSGRLLKRRRAVAVVHSGT